MKCHKVRTLLDPYLDSELDVRTSSEIHQHLATCAECRRTFVAEEARLAQLTEALRRGQSTPALWAAAEKAVRQAANVPVTLVAPPDAPRLTTWLMCQAGKVRRGGSGERTCGGWRAWVWPNPEFYAAIAAVWAVILTLNLLSADRADTPARTAAIPPPEARQAFVLHRRELAELLGLAEPVLTSRPTAHPSPDPTRRTPERTRPTTFAPIVLPENCA
jgi:hypothetical protein